MGEVVAVSGERNEKLGGPAGEQNITNVLLKLTRTRWKTSASVPGTAKSQSPTQGGHGLSQANDELKRKVIRTREVNLVSTAACPRICTVIVTPDPRNRCSLRKRR